MFDLIVILELKNYNYLNLNNIIVFSTCIKLSFRIFVKNYLPQFVPSLRTGFSGPGCLLNDKSQPPGTDSPSNVKGSLEYIHGGLHNRL